MGRNLKIIESKECLELKDTTSNKIIAKIYLNDYVSKKDAEKFLKDIMDHINKNQVSSMQEKMKILPLSPCDVSVTDEESVFISLRNNIFDIII